MHDLNAPNVDVCILHPVICSDTRQLVGTHTQHPREASRIDQEGWVQILPRDKWHALSAIIDSSEGILFQFIYTKLAFSDKVLE